ncbi:hypothetical protein BJ322DRAFT_450903 [Thelephora terrestris]|uniref:Uncharacterized protein n=1 Tax=Thelephora terrestris TaxID=56493 RepID=A0A9P6L2F2_9AGAM|nr:hypothetical protein BJ322DRAFT_450903 [Thelephora terrestris]
MQISADDGCRQPNKYVQILRDVVTTAASLSLLSFRHRMMSEEDLPPPYSLTLEVEQPRDPTPRPRVAPKPSASLLRSSRPASVSSPGALNPLGPSSSSHGLPTYRASASAKPPGTNLDLSAFTAITMNIKRQLVTLGDIKTHLRLLRAFKLFKEKVGDPYSDPSVGEIVPPVGRGIGVKGRWLWFLEMAVERFRRWVMLHLNYEGPFIIPPVDVWLIWNTYMLNPSWYIEDCERLWQLRPLRDLEEHPLNLAARMGDEIFKYRPAGDQERRWEAGTQLPFDPFVSSAILTDLEVECPNCERQVNTPIVNAEKTGFAQTDFATVCPRCNAFITREALGVAKFIKDIILDPNDRAHVGMHGKGVYLPGTLLLPSGTFQTDNSARLKANIKYLEVFRNDNAKKALTPPSNDLDLWKKAIGEKLRFNAIELRKNVEKAIGVNEKMIRRILGAYVDGKPFSVELVAAAMRQSTFVDKIHELGWLNPGFLGNPDCVPVLQHCILRYHGFLTLLSTDPGNKSFFVPTLDVDLAWHTHQLSPKNYSEDCRKIAFRLIDHDDQVEEGNLAIGLDNTSRAWRNEFGIPYLHCGCPVKDIGVGERLVRALSSRPRRIDPPTNRDDCYAATHPSEHNSVFVIGRSGLKRTLQQAEWRRRRDEEGQKIGKGKRVGKGTEVEERYMRGRDHEFPFSSPVPKVHGYGCPHAQNTHRGACAVGVSGCAVRV